VRNVIRRVGLIPGRGGLYARRNGIQLWGGSSEAACNRLSDIGYIGIHHFGGKNRVRRNVIQRFNRTVFDGGAIYTCNNQRGTVVEENIVLHGMATGAGLVEQYVHGTGIQCDARSEDITIRNNTIAHLSTTTQAGAIHLNFNSRNIRVAGNTIFVRGTGISTLDRQPFKPDTLTEKPPPSMYGNRFEGNTIVRMTSEQPPAYPRHKWAVFALTDWHQCDLDRQGLFRNNACVFPFTAAGGRCILESQRMCRYPGGKDSEQFFTAEEWNAARPFAGNNTDSPVRVSEPVPDGLFQFFYNDSDRPKAFPLPEGRYVDARNRPHQGEVTVPPWRSTVLLNSGIVR
jgi:hypothetical protein